jgi:hypothetical protein
LSKGGTRVRAQLPVVLWRETEQAAATDGGQIFTKNGLQMLYKKYRLLGMKEFCLTSGAWLGTLAVTLLAGAQLGTTSANDVILDLPKPAIGPKVGLPPESTPCIYGSCIYNSTNVDWYTTYDYGCLIISQPVYNSWKLTIEKWECIPQGYPNYVYSYVCNDEFIGYCVYNNPDPKDPCPSGNCTK